MGDEGWGNEQDRRRASGSHSRGGRRLGVALLCAALSLAATGCEDLRQFAGRWSGPISRDPAHQHGFGASATLDVVIGTAMRGQLEATLTPLPGHSDPVPFRPIRHAADDVLGDVRFAGEPLRTYFGFVEPPGELPYLGVISLFSEDRVEVRLIRGADDAYGVFHLKRVRPE